MDHPQTLAHALAEHQQLAREQLEAAWQLHVDRVRQQLASGWKDHIEQVFEERYRNLAAQMEEALRYALADRLAEELDAFRVQTRDVARRELAEELNQAARRLRQFETERQWAAALLDSAARFAARTALVAVAGQALRGFAGREPAGPEIPLCAAPAFQSVIESRDTLIGLATPAELSEPVARLFQAESKIHLIPVVAGERVAAVLCAQDDAVDVAALELLAAVAGAAVVARRTALGRAPAALVAIAGGNHEEARRPEWESLSPDQQDLHLRAQRFARVQAAEMRLYKSDGVKAGRARRDLYQELKADIDAGREAFHRQFMAASDSMVDYLHLELVHTLANDDASLLGPDYPGPLA